MREIITNYIRAGYAGLFLVSHEEARVEAELKAIAQALKHPLHAWSITEGLVDTARGTTRDCNDPLEALTAIAELPENSILLLRDFHAFFEDPNPVLIRQLKDQLRSARTTGKTVAVLGCRLNLPPELEREFAVIDFALPGPDQLGVVLEGLDDPELLAHPPAVVADRPGEVTAGELKPLDEPRPARRRAPVEGAEVVEEVGAGHPVVQGDPAGKVADPSPDLDARRRGREPEDAGTAAGRVDEAEEQADAGALAGPVRAEEAEDLPRPDDEIDLVERTDGRCCGAAQPPPEASPGPVVLRQAGGLDHAHRVRLHRPGDGNRLAETDPDRS